MNHKERIRLANEIVKKLISKYKKDIIAITLYGSTARNEDTKYSDIELNVFTKRPIKLETKEYLFRNIVIGIFVHPIKELETKIKNVNYIWPLEMAQYTNNKLLYGNINFLHDLQKRIDVQSLEKRKQVIEECIPNFIDLLNKTKATRNLNDILEYSREILYQINLSVGLLNKRVFKKNYYKNFLDAYNYPKLPKEYEKLVKEIHICRNTNKIKKLIDRLAKNYFEFLDREGIKKKIYKDLSFI